MVRNIFLIGLLVMGVIGCNSEVGECNLDDPSFGPAALSITYRAADGLPMFEGQALVQSTCGNGSFCHSPAAERGERFGVPKGLDFDVSLACDDQDPSCISTQTCSEGSSSEYCTRLARLEDGQQRALGLGRNFVSQVKSGSMPPGAAGKKVRDPASWARPPNADPLPSIDSKEGKEIVRNWIACGAPVVARTETPPTPDDQSQPCPSFADEVCIYRGPVVVPDPTWSSIYFEQFMDSCVTCHAPANGASDLNPDRAGEPIPGGASPAGLAALDLSGSDPTDTSEWAFESHARVVGVPASAAGDCSGEGTLVVAGDPAVSLLVQKLRNEQTCGDPMPQNGDLLLNDVISVVEQWITDGAAND